jgi:hypothetical protein
MFKFYVDYIARELPHTRKEAEHRKYLMTAITVLTVNNLLSFLSTHLQRT